ncbi:MAG: hypothetical protein Tsb0020_26170 [Haliangiales bacterium]
MRQIESIRFFTPSGLRSIELYAGDLTALPAEAEVDILVISAYPGAYYPSRGSVIGGLYRRGISVAKLARSKTEDLRLDFGCWLSDVIPGARFRRILCFEPAIRGRPPEVVEDLFRCLAAICSPSLPIRSVAMAIIAAGDQGYPAELMLERIIECAAEWMHTELPLEQLRIVCLDRDVRWLRPVFAAAVSELPRADRSADAAETSGWDVVLSAAASDHEHAALAMDVMSTVAPELRIYPTAHVPMSAAEVRRRRHALDSCQRVMVLLSPDYLSSRLYQDELCVACFRSHAPESPVLFPIYLREADLPPMARALRMIDCRERDLSSLRVATALLAVQLIGVLAYEHASSDPASSQQTTHMRLNELSQLLGVPVVGSTRRHHDIGAPGSVSREAALLEFCRSAFTTAEFRVFIRHCPDGQRIVESLPDAVSSPLLVYADLAIELLAKRGSIDAEFFERMRMIRPGRAADIQQLQQLW